MNIFIKSFVFILIFSFSYFLFYNQIYNGYPSDIIAHVTLAGKVGPVYELEVTYPMWHIIVYSVSDFFYIDIRESAAFVTALIIVILAMIVYGIVKYSLQRELLNISNNQKEYLFLALTVVSMMATAVYVPFFNKNLYIGQGNSGVWHNVTLLMVKPFAFLSLFSTVLYFETKSVRWGLFALPMALLSIYAKPSYIVAFLPAVFIFFPLYVMQQTGLNVLQIGSRFVEICKLYKHELLFLIILSFLSIIILWGQYTSVYAEVSTSKIVIDFLGVWSLLTTNVAVSILLTYLFPIAVLLLVWKKDSNAFILALIMNFVSVLLFAVFAEEGPRYAHGNFGWSQQISIQLLFTFSLIVFVKKYNQLKNWRKYILSVALSLHVVSGIFYLIKISIGFPYK